METQTKYRKLQPYWCGTGLERTAELLSDENIAKLRAAGDNELADALKSQQQEFFEKFNPSPEREAKIAVLQMRIIQLEQAIEIIQAVADDSR